MSEPDLLRLRTRIHEALTREYGGGPPDARVRELVRVVLEDSDDVARSFALEVLLLLPQRRVIAREIATAVAAHRDDANPVVLLELLEVLKWLAHSDGMDPIVRLLLDPSSSPDVVAACGIAVGNMTDHDEGSRSARAEAAARRARHVAVSDSRVGDGSVEQARIVLRALLYVIGMTGRLDLVADLRRSARTNPDPAFVRMVEGACDWWLGYPAHLRAGAAPDRPARSPDAEPLR